jgi:hypothetical protein
VVATVLAEGPPVMALNGGENKGKGFTQRVEDHIKQQEDHKE